MSYLLLPPEKQLAKYEKLTQFLQSIGFEKMTLKRRALENKSIELSKPTRKRQEETEKCAVWRKYYEGGYFIEVLPTFNEEQKVFSSQGIASVLIKTPSKTRGFKKIFQMYFNRTEEMENRISALSSFLNKVLQNRPYGEDFQLMDLAFNSKKYEYVFQTRDSHIRRRAKKILLVSLFFLEKMPPGPYRVLVRKIFKDRQYYHENKLEGTIPIQQIKKKRRVKNPQGAVPNMK